MCRVYFEVGEHQGVAREVIEAYLGSKRSQNLAALPYGYECELAIQCVPDVLRELAKRNISAYQVVRYAKTKDVRTSKVYEGEFAIIHEKNSVLSVDCTGLLNRIRSG